MRPRFEQGGNLRGVLRIISAEGMRPDQSVKPSANEIAALKALLDSVRNPHISSTEEDAS